MNYYISETVQEAKSYRDYSKKTDIDVADIRLAIASKSFDSFTRPQPMTTIKEVARKVNKYPLPKVETIASVTEENVRNGAKPQTLPSTLPVSGEATVLVNPIL